MTPSLLLSFALLCAATATTTTTTWSTSGGHLLKDGSPVVLRGMGTTSTEYMLRSIGAPSWATYQWPTPSKVLAPNEAQLGRILAYLAEVKEAGTVPAVRIPLTASNWLGINTTAASHNMARFPALSTQYQSLIAALVDTYTKAGVVTILDLHWSDDDTEQQPMALKAHTDGSPTGNALDFWDSISAMFKDNAMVFYELYNEPHIGDVDAYLHGNTQYAGMLEMLSTVRKNAPGAVCVIAGAAQYAYDSDSLLALDKALVAAGESNVMYNFHPYMGPHQAGASKKCPAGFEALVEAVAAGTDKPMIITEFGQSCCATSGACESCPATYDGVAMGYDEAILTIATKHGVSWLPWAWRPGAIKFAVKTCLDINAINGTALAHPTNGQGPDWYSLWPKFAYNSSNPNPPIPPPAPTPGPAPGPSPGPTPGPAPGPGGTCRACGYNCDANCNSCGRCNTKPGCDSETQCTTTCNGGGNAKWCGGGVGPSPGPSGCPGGSLAACIGLCPSTPPAAYKACVQDCTARCS